MSRSKVNRLVTMGVPAASCAFLHLACVRRDFRVVPVVPVNTAI